MNTRSRILAGALTLLGSHAWCQESTGHSISRPGEAKSDSTALPGGLPPARPTPATFDDAALDSMRNAESERRAALGAALGMQPYTRSSTAQDSSRASGHWRAGLHASSHDIGLLLGASMRATSVSLGLDGWVRPGAFTKEVRITPTRRAQYKEVLWGFNPWIQKEFGSDFRLALAASLDMSFGTWYGTSQSPDSDIQPAAGVKILFPQYIQVGLRGTIGEGLLGRIRGDVVCEF